MKAHVVSLLVGLFLVVSAVQLLPNGVIGFNNLNAPPDGRIYHGEWVFQDGTYEFVNSQPCSGPSFHAALYWGPWGTPEAGLTQIGPVVGFLTGANAGTFAGGNRTIPSPDAGPMLTVQVRVWQGSFATYEHAIAQGGPGTLAGKGPVFDIDSKDQADQLEPAPIIGQAADWRGFIFGPDAVTVIIPEPSTIALAALAASSLFLLRRRKPGNQDHASPGSASIPYSNRAERRGNCHRLCDERGLG